MNQTTHRDVNDSVVDQDSCACVATIRRADARDLLEHHPCFHGHSDNIQIEYDRSTLVLKGSVPTFYLKQLLQELLRSVDGVARVDNRVVVISSQGLSSESILD